MTEKVPVSDAQSNHSDDAPKPMATAPTEHTDVEEYPPKAKFLVIFAGIMLSAFLVALVGSVHTLSSWKS